MGIETARTSTKRLVLRAFVASIVVSALLGIWALLSGDFNELQVKVLLSSLSVSAATLCALGGAALLEGRGERLPSLPAILLAGVGLCLVLVGMWTEIDSEAYWKGTSSTCFFAAASSHASLLRLARLAPRHAWVGVATLVLVFLLAVWGSVMVLGEIGSESGFRVLGVLSILVSAGTLATPVLHRLGRDERSVPRSIDASSTVEMLCPACGHRFHHALGDVACPRCQAGFSIHLAGR